MIKIIIGIVLGFIAGSYLGARLLSCVGCLPFI